MAKRKKKTREAPKQKRWKLVRDKIPERVRSSSRWRGEFRIATPFEREMVLRAKLVEEAREALNAEDSADLLVELADLQEVLDALLVEAGITRQALEHRMRTKRELNGGFEKFWLMEKRR